VIVWKNYWKVGRTTQVWQWLQTILSVLIKQRVEVRLL
jgi:hypothetical protein